MFKTPKPYVMLVMIVAAFCCQEAGAQEQGSLYIQSENNQVFYAQCNGLLFVSSATGYLMVPKMPPGDHTLVVAFPRNQYGEYAFICGVTEKPLAYSLKLAVDNSWSLFDMVSFSSIKGRQATAEEKAMLKPAIEKKTEENTPVVADSLQKAGAAGIQKIFDQTTESGIDQIYVVNNDGKMDTVVVLISFLPEARGTAGNQLMWLEKTPLSNIRRLYPPIAGELLVTRAIKRAGPWQTSK